MDASAEQTFDEECQFEMDNALGNIFDAIVSRPQASLKQKVAPTKTILSVDGREFELPNSLHRRLIPGLLQTKTQPSYSHCCLC